MKCGRCGTTVQDGAQFCPNCGARFVAQAAQQQVQARPQWTAQQAQQMQAQQTQSQRMQAPTQQAQLAAQPVQAQPQAQRQMSAAVRGYEVVAKDLVRYRGRGKKVTNDHISLTVRSGEFVALVGTSGAGKSTLLNELSGREPADEGRVLLDGIDLYKNYDALRYSIGVVPQQDVLHDDITLRQELLYAAKNALPEETPDEVRNDKVEKTLAKLELSEFANSYVRNLSGGQRKRGSIALELLREPRLLFLDEPDSGLDEGTTTKLMQVLRRLAREGCTVVMVTHAPHSVSFADRVAILGAGGKLCYYDAPAAAPGYFGVRSFGEIYDVVAKGPEMWQSRWLQVSGRTPEPTRPEVDATVDAPESTSFGRQLATLSARYVKLIFNDHSRFLLLILQAPLLAWLIGFFASDGCFEIYESTKSCLFSISCAAFWVGIFDSIQEICKERTIFEREYNSGIRISSYVLSKVLVLGGLCLVQSILIMVTFCLVVPETVSVSAPFGVLGFCLSIFVTMLSAMCVGLFVSSVFNNSERAMAMAPMLIMPQLLFSGVVIELKGAMELISKFVNCRWGMSALGSIAGLNGLMLKVEDKLGSLPEDKIAKLRPEIDATLFDRSGFNVFSAWAVLFVFCIVCVLGCMLVQWVRTRRKR